MKRKILKPIFNFVMLTGFLISASCARLPILTAKKNIPVEQNEMTGNYDRETNIRYHVTHDSSEIYLKFYTADIRTQIQMLRGGLSFYFDENGKTKADKSWTFPHFSPAQAKRNLATNSTELFSVSTKKRSQMLYQLFQLNEHYILLKGFDGTESHEVIQRNDEKSPVRINTLMDSAGVFHLIFAIQKSKLFKPERGVHNFSIGVRSAGSQRQNHSFTRSSGQNISKGGRGGKGKGGMTGTGKGSMSATPADRKKGMEASIDFWFRVNFEES